MWISQACKATGLTKKAIEYYLLQGLISPSVSDSGYRDYSAADIALLHKVSVLRRLDIGVDEIKTILMDESGSALQAVSVRKELRFQREAAKKAILSKLSGGASYSEIDAELRAIDPGKTIAEKLLEAFPGYYGRFICLHFARFLNVPVETERQQAAYDTIVSFLDGVPPFALPRELQTYLIESTRHIGTEQITKMLESARTSIEHPDEFLSGNKELLAWYLSYKQSDAYKRSPAYKIAEFMKEFNSASGYCDVFIPALKQLSSAYSQYCRQLELAHEKLLEQYPEIEKRNGPGQ